MSDEREDPVTLDIEYEEHRLPESMMYAVRFAAKHDRVVVLGYIEDEKKVYLMTVEDERA